MLSPTPLDMPRVPTTATAEAIGRATGLPVTSIPAMVAGHVGLLGGLLALDSPTSSSRTRELLDWTPTHSTRVEGLDACATPAEPTEPTEPTIG